MEITDELRLAILALWHKAQEKDVDSYCEFLRTTAEKIGLPYNELTRLVFDKEFLLSELYPKIEEIDSKVQSLQKQIDELEHEKKLLGKMVCEIHGHTIDLETIHDSFPCCKVCGEKVSMRNTNVYLMKTNQFESGFYPKR